jgi:hypothetical protein
MVAETSRPATSTHYGTVTNYQAGRLLEIKERDRIGRHVYELADMDGGSGEVPNLNPGDQVTITERIDQNGHRSIQVARDDRTQPQQ